MVTINNDIQEESCFLYGPNNELIGEIENYLAFLDVRCQILENNLQGYYVSFRAQKYKIDSNGRLHNYPSDLFSKAENYLYQLVCWD